MPIGNKTIFVFLYFLTTGVAMAQIDNPVSSGPFERYWTKARIIPKFGAGIQGSGFAEAGIQLHKIYVHPLTLASAGPYITCDLVIAESNVIIGPKAGYEVTTGLIGFAADVGYYSDFERESLLITPKLGLSLLGFANLFYGRSFTLSEDSFSSISVSRLSLIINFNKDYFDLREARRKQ